MSFDERWEQAEVERRREWAALEQRFVTAEEKRQAFDDALFLKVNAVNAQFLEVLHEIDHSLQALNDSLRALNDSLQAFRTEMREEQQAIREALLQILDRLPPSPEAS